MNGDDFPHEFLRMIIANPGWSIVFVVIVGSGITGLVRSWMKHRYQIAKLRYENLQNAASAAEVAKLQERCVALEKRCATLEQSNIDAAALNARCAKLEEQILAAHIQLADERRTLDNKLHDLLTDAPATERELASKKAPVKTVL